MPARANKLKKVLFCEAGHHGGSVKRLLTFLGSIDEIQILPVLLTFYRDGKAGRFFELPGTFPRESMGVEYDPIPDTIRMAWKIPMPTIFAARYFWRSVKALRRHRPDVVYLNNTPFCHLPMIAACRWFGVPMICHMRDTIRLTRAERWALEGISRVVVLSEAARKHYGDQGVPHEKMEVVYNGISLDEFDRKKLEGGDGIPAGRSVVALTGLLVPRKRQMVAIRAVQRLVDEFPDILLVLYGDGPDRGAIEDYVEKNGLTNHVKVHGWTDNVAGHLANAKIGLMVSEREGMPNVVMEYMAASVPVVATNLSGIDEMVVEGVNGFIVEVDDVASLAGRLAALVRDEESRQTVGRNGRAMLESGKFTIDAEHERIRSIILGVAQ